MLTALKVAGKFALKAMKKMAKSAAKKKAQEAGGSVLSFMAKLVGVIVILYFMFVEALFSTFLCTITFSCDDENEKKHVYSDKEITEFAEEIQEARKEANEDDDLSQKGMEFEDREMIDKDEDGDPKTMNDAEVFLRSILQTTHFVTLINYNEEKLESEKYKDTQLGKTWAIAKKMKEKAFEGTNDAAASRRNPNHIGNGAYSDLYRRANSNNFNTGDYIKYAQIKMVQCYFLGDEGDENYCEDLKEINDGEDVIKKDDQGVVNHKRVTTEIRYTCVDDPDYEPSEETAFMQNKQLTLTTGTSSEGLQLVHHKDTKIEGDKPNCGEGKKIEKNTYKTSSLEHRTTAEMLWGYEKYSIYVQPEVISETEPDFKDFITNVLKQLYENYNIKGGIPTVTVGGGGFIIPMEPGTYNWEGRQKTIAFRNPIRKDHNGSDLGNGGVNHVPVYASAGGQVEYAGWIASGYGATVLLKHPNGYYTQYQHLDEEYIVVKKGQTVQQGQLLAGASGFGYNRSDSKELDWHLHFEAGTSLRSPDMVGNFVDPWIDENERDGVTDPVQLDFKNDQDVNLTKERAKEFKDEWFDKAMDGEIIIMPGFVPTGIEGGGFLGGWVSEYEGEVGSIGWDSTGLDSFGTFQIKAGRIGEFGNFLNKNYPEFHQSLAPYKPASTAFHNRWKDLALKQPMLFEHAQWDFIYASHYGKIYPSVVPLISEYDNRHRAVKEMVWSISVQHGPYTSVIKNALSGKNTSSMSDEEIINAVYEERRKVNIYFSKSTQAVKNAVKNRFYNEEKKLLELMKAYPSVTAEDNEEEKEKE